MFKSENNTLNITPELLGLSDVKVIAVNTDVSRNEIIIKVKSTRKRLTCRKCGEPTQKHGTGRLLRLRHLSMFGRDTIIEIAPRRGICKICDKNPTTTERLDWYEVNAKLTKPLEQFLLFELVNSTVADVSRKCNVDYRTVDDLIERYIEKEIDFTTISKLGVLGLDEISMKKGYRDFVTLVTYRIDSKVHILGVVEGREKKEIVKFLRTIPVPLRRTIDAACCDLYEGYINACKEVFENNIPVVADRFHVRRLYRKSLVNLRKSELARLKRQLTKKEYLALKPAIALLRKQKDYFIESEKQVVEPLFSLTPKLKQAYQFSRELTAIFDSHISEEIAKEKISDWIVQVKESELNCFNKFMETLTKHMIEVTNYFMQRYNSGFVEGFNNKVKVLKRRCYGLSSAIKLFQRLIIDTLGLERFAYGVSVF
jgi:transposase